MALNAPRPAVRLARRAAQTCRSASICRPTFASSVSSFSTSHPLRQEDAAPSFATSSSDELPRWARTPERMKAPFSPHITKNPNNSKWHTNADPQKLDRALNNLLGKGGDRLLPEELKWLAVTHKSFDQGRRGFNDRLAYFGRQLAIVEAMQSILAEPVAEGAAGAASNIMEDPFGDRRQPFENRALDSTDNLCTTQPNDIFDHKKLHKLAVETGINEVMRWKPRNVENLKASGIAPVMSGGIFAIVGAIGLQHGAKAAGRVVRERILRKIK
ncbi:ribonuclease-III-like-domain-containing protein [Xylariales sp. PMI_506]|nr:ribonuclease-III-like-domain-containing protein [Xylariales sp. PMI_506]